ncbi:hypothetical protein BOX15_Mlig031201g2, partial [Macrostomum lignano]
SRTMIFMYKIDKAAAISLSIQFTLLLAAQANNRNCSKPDEYFDPGQQMCLRCPLPSSEILIHLHYLSTCRDHPVCCVANTTSGSAAVPSWKPPHSSSSSSSSSCSSGTTTLSSPLQAQGMSTSWMVFGAAAPVLAIALIMLGVWKFSHKSQELPHGFRTGAEVGNATGEEDGNAAEITGAPGSVTGSGSPEGRDGEARLQLLSTALENRNPSVNADGDEGTAATGTYEFVP